MRIPSTSKRQAPKPATSRKTAAKAARAAGATRPTADPGRVVLRQFRMIFNAVRAHFAMVEKASGVAGAQVWALSVISGTPGVTVSALAKAMDVHQSTASNLVRALVSAELIRTARASADRRVVTLTATAAGKALLRRAPQPFGGLLPSALAQMDPAVLARMKRDLDVLVNMLDPDTRSARKPLADM